MKKKIMKRIGSLSAAGLLMGLIAYASVYPMTTANAENSEATTVLTTQTSDEGVIDVTDYEVEITVNNNYTVDVSERVTVEFVQEDTQSFFRVIPYAPDEVLALSVACRGNEALQYIVVEERDGVRIECLGGVELGSVWTYEIDYTVALRAKALTEEFVFNIINDGWQNTVDNVIAKITVPDSIVNYDVYNGVGGRAQNVSTALSEDGKTITVSSNKTEAVAAASNAITVKIYLPDEETIEDFNVVSELANEKIWTPIMVVALVLGSILAICCIALI